MEMIYEIPCYATESLTWFYVTKARESIIQYKRQVAYKKPLKKDVVYSKKKNVVTTK
jgi:hypothetical protein